MDMYSSFWENEFADLELYDARISKRLVSLMSSMSSKPGATFIKLGHMAKFMNGQRLDPIGL